MIRPLLLSLFLHAAPVVVLVTGVLPGSEAPGGSGGGGWEGVALLPVRAEPAPAPALDVPVWEVSGSEADAPPSPAGGGDAAPAGPALPGPPSPVFAPCPAYPERARAAGWEGAVEVALELDAGGRVAAARVLTSSGHEALDAEALRALRRWRFPPPGASARLVQRVVFRL